MHSNDLSWHHSIIDLLQLLSLSTCVRMAILSIGTVMVHLLLYSPSDDASWEWCRWIGQLLIISPNNKCSSCYQSMDICFTCDRSIMHSTNAILRSHMVGPVFIPCVRCSASSTLKVQRTHCIKSNQLWYSKACPGYRFTMHSTNA